MTAPTTALDTLRDLDTRIHAFMPDVLQYAAWLAYRNSDGVWCVMRSDCDDVAQEECFGPGDAGEEAALREAIRRNQMLAGIVEPVALEVEG